MQPSNSSDPFILLKLTAKINVNSSILHSINNNNTSNVFATDSRNLTISVQVLQSATKNFATENVLGQGGFGVAYKGELHDAVLSNKASDEFHSEIALLSRARHGNLVSILGYSVEDNERLLVDEYMHQGALSKQLFQWKQLELEPLSWKKSLDIALDVNRGMEYLHNLAHQSFIHKDLKSSNILLGDDYRAKVSDFGLVRLAPDEKESLATRFGYILSSRVCW